MATGFSIQEIDGENSVIGEELAPPSPTVQPILLKSSLQKKGKRFKGWHQRYFEVQGSHMYYYNNSSKADCLGEIDLSKCIHCKISTEASFGSPFEIRTAFRTHVLSSRSKEERDQWIHIINAQMRKTSSSIEQRISDSRPKRWQTFRNAFKLPRQPNTKIKKRTIMEKLRFRKAREPAHLRVKKESSEGPALHNNRPLSMIEDETPNLDFLETLLDVAPCRSLPATPLARKRSDIYPPGKDISFPSISSVVDESVVSGDDVLHNLSDITTTSVESNEQLNSDYPVNKLQHSDVNTVTEVNIATEKGSTWDEVREFLHQKTSASTPSLPSDILSSDDQIWMKQSCGIEQLRVFLTVCD